MSVFDYEAMLSSSLEYSLTALWVVITTILFLKFQKRRARRAELDRWIHRSRHETRTKVQRCLELSSTNAAEEEEEEESSSRLSAKEVRDRILSRKLDPAQHVVALAKRCRKYGRDESRSNAITEELYDDAYDIAKNLQPSNKDNSPLYGVPISVKDSIGIRGCLSTGGLACRLKERAQRDSLIVQVLKSAGAIPLCRGNVPQIMMLPESHNRIWGRSRNPYDLSRTPGGSSGGDAALVAMRCVPLAVCSDVAGSIRIPAAFCGIVGFKPTSTRLSYKGVMKPRKGNKSGTSVAIPATVGPIARSVEDCALFMKAVCVSELFDGDLNVPRIPFDDKEYQSKTKLKIGYFETDAWFEPCAAAKRGLHETIAALEKAGHTCVPYDSPTDGWASYGLLVAINAAEGNMRNFVEALEGEELIPEYGTLWKASNLPNWLRPIVLQLIDKRRGHLLKSGRKLTI
jgi:fatty acid amide hydrolase